MSPPTSEGSDTLGGVSENGKAEEPAAVTALEAIPEHEVERRLPGYYSRRVGRPNKYPPEVVEQALWEMAAAGSNAARASRQLYDHGITQAYPEAGGLPIPPRTIIDWAHKTYRNRYSEMKVTSVRQLEELVAQRGMDFALTMHEAEAEALRQTLAGLPNATAVEASRVLSDLSKSKQIQVRNALELRGQGAVDQLTQTLDQVLSELKGLGLTREEPVDAEVVDD